MKSVVQGSTKYFWSSDENALRVSAVISLRSEMKNINFLMRSVSEQMGGVYAFTCETRVRHASCHTWKYATNRLIQNFNFLLQKSQIVLENGINPRVFLMQKSLANFKINFSAIFLQNIPISSHFVSFISIYALKLQEMRDLNCSMFKTSPYRALLNQPY